MTEADVLEHFTMRTTPPKAGEDWFRIVEAKKSSDPTKVYIYDEIGYWGTTAKAFAAILDDIDTAKIELHLNSPGGSVFDGIAIYNSLKQHKAEVTAIVDGLAASAASFILQAADIRVANRNAQLMIHDAKAYAGGDARAMLKASKLLDGVSDNIADIYAQRGEYTKNQYRELMLAETWYTGQSAKDDGLVDQVTDGDDDEDADNKATNFAEKWDLKSLYKFSDVSEAPVPAAVLNTIAINPETQEDHMTGTAPQNQPAAPVAPVVPVAPAPAPVAPAASVHEFIVNGTKVSDFAAVQAHIEALETYKNEAVKSARTNFVKQLCNDGKLLATEEGITANTNFALSLTNEQFDAWKASMDAAPKSTLLGNHGVGPGDASAPQNGGTQDATAQRLATLKEIVASHKAGGMPQSEIENTGSYKELQLLTNATK